MTLQEALAKYWDDRYKRSELVKGKVAVRRIPFVFSKQGYIETWLRDQIDDYNILHRQGKSWGGVGYLIDKELHAATLRCSAITFIREGRYNYDPELDDGSDNGFITVPPDLAIEFTNQPHIAKYDYSLPPDLDNEDSDNYWPQKLADYQRFGVNLLWIIDLTKEVVYEYRQPQWQLVTLKGAAELDGGEALPGFLLQVQELFARRNPRLKAELEKASLYHKQFMSVIGREIELLQQQTALYKQGTEAATVEAKQLGPVIEELKAERQRLDTEMARLREELSVNSPQLPAEDLNDLTDK